MKLDLNIMQYMRLKEMFEKMSFENRGLHYKLSIIFAFFFLVPLVGFIYFSLKYNILDDEYTPVFVIALLVSSFFGYNIIRNIFDEIRSASQNMTESIAREIKVVGQAPPSTSEMQGIVQSFQAIEKELLNSFRNLDRRVSQISTLKELSDLCYVTLDTEDLLHVTLERALKLVGGDIGSVLLLEENHRESFIIQALIGQPEMLHKGDRIAFSDSIAKYAVINKSPLLIDDIEKDIRFRRSNRSVYGTKSFICMPLKGIKEVIGVVNISRRDSDVPFTHDDVEVLTPMLSSAALTYDNLELIKRKDYSDRHIKVLRDIQDILGSSLRNSELINALLKQVKEDIACDMIMILLDNENSTGHLNVVEFMSEMPATLHWQKDYPYVGTMIERVLKQGITLAFVDSGQEIHPTEEALFRNHQILSCFLSPLKVDGAIKGILAVGFRQPHSLTGANDLVEHIAGLAAIAMEKNRLSASVLKRNQEMAIIKQIGEILAASTFDIQDVLGHTMDLIRATLEVEAGSLLLIEKDELVFNVAFNADKNVSTEILRSLRLKLGQGIAGYCAARGEPIMFRDVRESKQFYPEFDRCVGFTTRSVLCVPLISLGRVIGVIEVINKLGSEFNDNDLRLLQSIATSVSIALENARLYRETLSMAEHERDVRNVFQKFVPKEIVDKILHKVDGEKLVVNELKTMTLMNIDIRGFSTLARSLGSQKTVAILNHFFSVMGECVFKHHGIVDKYLGDGFLALFGVPVNDIHDADHAAAAALEMKAAIGSVNAYFRDELGEPMHIGISIHTGEAVVGNIGFEKKMDYTVIGDSVNIVFRLQELTRAVPNGILVSENTVRALSSSNFAMREAGIHDVGKTLGEMKIYELMGLKEE